jgi:vacuolar-type H+-ATPase subunit B/Vma2
MKASVGDEALSEEDFTYLGFQKSFESRFFLMRTATLRRVWTPGTC